MNETLLTCTEVQAILRIGKSKLYRLIHSGALPVIRLGNTYRIRKSELENYLEKQAAQHKNICDMKEQKGDSKR